MSDTSRTPASGHEATTAELLKRLSEQVSTLVSQEIALAKAEVSEKGRRAGIGAGMFGGAGVAGLYAVGALLATIILVLVEIGLAPWLAALVVTVVLGAAAAALALQGRSQVQQAAPPAPERTIASVKRDTETIRTSAQAGRNAR